VKNQLTLKTEIQIESVEMYNLLRSKCFRNMPNSLKTQLNTGHLEIGVYVMKVTIENSAKTLKIIKK